MERPSPNRTEIAARPRPRREIVIPEAVRWHDGMPLAPQHFQEAFRRVERLLDHHLGAAAPYHYGVLRLDIDRGRLSAGELCVRVDAILPDRLVVRTGSDALTMKLDAGELAKKAANPARGARRDLVDVFLAVPWERAGAAASGELPRYLSTPGEPIRDDTTGEDALDVERLVPNARLVVDVDPPADSAWLRLAQLRLEGEAFSRAEYVPPTLTVSTESPLYALCSRLVEHVRNTGNRLGERLNQLSGSTDRELIAETRRQIHHLTAALPVLEATLFTEEAHPFALYAALAAMTGQLAALGRNPVPPPPPHYRHDELFATFSEIEARIQRIIREGIQESFRAYPFDVAQGSFTLDYSASWSGRTLVLAVRQRHGGSERDAVRWLEGAVIGPQRALRDLVQSRALGLRRELVSRLDDLVPTSGEVLFELKSPGDLMKADEPLVVQNPAREADPLRPTELVLYVKKDPA